MAKNSEQQVLLTKTLDDLFSHLDRNSTLRVLGGCTWENLIDEKSVSVRGIPELSQIERRERFIDVGPAVTLSEMLKVDKTKIQPVLREALMSIGNAAVRNLATLGGNICAEGQKLTLWSPLVALDTRFEIKKSANDSKVIPLSHFTGVPEKSVLSKIRIPTTEWKTNIFERVGPSHRITENSASFTFLCNTERGSIDNISIVFAGVIVFHSKEFENILLGTHLPIKKEDMDAFIQTASEIYDSIEGSDKAPTILKTQFLNLLRSSLSNC